MPLLDRDDSVLVVVDAQPGFLPDEAESAVARMAWLVALAGRLGIPVVVTEEEPERNGSTPRRLPAATTPPPKPTLGPPRPPAIPRAPEADLRARRHAGDPRGRAGNGTLDRGHRRCGDGRVRRAVGDRPARRRIRLRGRRGRDVLARRDARARPAPPGGGGRRPQP